MRCSDARRKLSALLDGEGDPTASAALARHVEGCPGCRAELEALARVDRALHDVLDAEPPADLVDGLEARVRARIAAEGPPRLEEIEDLRALAAHAIERAGASAPAAPAMELVSAPAALGQVVLPVPDAAPRRRRWPLLAAAGVAAAALVGTSFVLNRSDAPPIVATAAPESSPPPPPAAPASAPPPAVAVAPAPPPAEAAEEKGAAPKKTLPRPAAPAATPAPAPAAPQKSADEIIEELTEPAAPAAAAGGAPGRGPGDDKLSHEQIKAGMASVRRAVQACYTRHQTAGIVIVTAHIQPDGKVTAVEPTGGLGGESAACVARAARDATFASYDGAPMVVKLSFKLEEAE